LFQRRDGPTGGKSPIGSLEHVASGTTEPRGVALLPRGEWAGKKTMKYLLLTGWKKTCMKNLLLRG